MTPFGTPYPVAAAGEATTLAEVATAARGCTACPDLVASRSQVVPGIFPAGADVLFVGEAPGAQEDLLGAPFVGRSGQLLDTLLGDAGLARDRVAVTNVVKCRPEGNRKPRRVEVGHCRSWLSRQIELHDPVVIVALGGTAAEWFFGPSARIAALRETVQMYDGRRVVVTYHPSAAIRFGPKGAPLAALREDLRVAARLAAGLRTATEAPVHLRDELALIESEHGSVTVTVTVPTAEDMRELGRQLASLMRPGDVVMLTGPLGAGKTTLTQGIGAGLGVRGPVTSPTFVLARVHAPRNGATPLVHVDAYRLGSLAEVDDLDLDTSLEESVTVIEWGEGKVEQLADDRLEILMERPSGASETRRVTMRGTGARWRRVALLGQPSVP